MARKCPSELISSKLEPSLHFESCFSGIQLLVVDEPSPWPVSLITFLGKLLAKLSLDFVFCAEVISRVTFFPGFARQDLFENAELATNEAQSDQQSTSESPSVFRKQSKRIVHHPESKP